MARKAVVTGIGIISSLGDNAKEVLTSLKECKSGISYSEEYAEKGFRSHVYGMPKIDLNDALDRKNKRFMGDGAAYNYLSMEEAITDSGPLRRAGLSRKNGFDNGFWWPINSQSNTKS